MPDPQYPKREPFFANRFIRLITKRALANEIGDSACFLLCLVAMQEDAKKYTGPVNWFNHQLAPLCGCDPEGGLNRRRSAAVNAGWLYYRSGGKRRPGIYWVTIPEHLQNTPDGSCDEDTPTNSSNEPSEKEVIYPHENVGENNLPPRIRQDKRRINAGKPSALHTNTTNTTYSQRQKPPHPPETGGGAVASGPVQEVDAPTPIEQRIMDAWNAADGTVRISRMTDKRSGWIRARLKKPPWEWEKALAKFPLGVFPTSNGWMPTLEWFCRPDTVLKILEGAYDRKFSPNGSNGRTRPVSPAEHYDPNAHKNPEHGTC